MYHTRVACKSCVACANGGTRSRRTHRKQMRLPQKKKKSSPLSRKIREKRDYLFDYSSTSRRTDLSSRYFLDFFLSKSTLPPRLLALSSEACSPHDIVDYTRGVLYQSKGSTHKKTKQPPSLHERATAARQTAPGCRRLRLLAVHEMNICYLEPVLETSSHTKLHGCCLHSRAAYVQQRNDEPRLPPRNRVLASPTTRLAPVLSLGVLQFLPSRPSPPPRPVSVHHQV